jgi:DNA-binding beta-propeller fold protein YncE
MGNIFRYLMPALLSGSPAFAVEPFAAIPLPGAAASFDFMAADPGLDRVLAAHRDARTLEIVDLKTGKALKPVSVGAAQGVAVNAAEHMYYVGNEADKNVVAIDARTFAIKGKTKVDGPVDAIAFDPTNSRIYAAEDDGKRVWVIDSKTMELVQVIDIPGVPEVLEYDAATDRLYLNIKNKDVVVRIDPATSRVDATWPVAPVTAPHGLAIDHEWALLLTVGSNGKLASLDLHTGKVIASADVAPGVDQIAYDDNAKVVYGAAKGFLTSTKVEKTSLTSLPNIASPKGAHTVAVDSTRHEVWMCFKDAKHSYLQKFGHK